MFKNSLFLLLFTLLMLCISPARAFNCARVSGMAEQAVCSSPQLMWLDGVYNDDFYDRVKDDPQHAEQLIVNMHHEPDACSSESCLRSAYLYVFSKMYGTERSFDWEGTWWNTSASQGNSGKILITSPSGWGFRMDATVQGGIYQTALRADVRQYYGIGFSDKIAWGGDCAMMLIPLPDGRLKVTSDSTNSCKLLMSGGVAIDGIYTKSASDPRPAATLLSLGILPDRQTDEKFRQLVGNDYQKYVDTATAFTRENDLDNLGASVVTMWVKGRADRQAAMIMTDPQGKIWALRVEPTKGDEVTLHYATTEPDKKRLPNTLSGWQARFNVHQR